MQTVSAWVRIGKYYYCLSAFGFLMSRTKLVIPTIAAAGNKAQNSETGEISMNLIKACSDAKIVNMYVAERLLLTAWQMLAGYTDFVFSVRYVKNAFMHTQKTHTPRGQCH